MAKKTKKEKQVEIKNTNKTAGNVKITLYHGDKKYKVIDTHNSGTIDLCGYLRDALVGDYVIARRPGIIAPCFKDRTGKLVDIGNGSPYVSNKKISYEDEDVSAAATITFLIPSTLLVAGQKIEGFHLYSKDESKKLYAEVDLEDLSFSVLGDTNMKVEWTLIVSYEWVE